MITGQTMTIKWFVIFLAILRLYKYGILLENENNDK